MRAHVWADGSCVQGDSARFPMAPRSRAGGWAAIVEHGADGWVLRGRQAGTTNTRMELRAMVEGLRSLPDGTTVELHVDCTVVYSVRDRWERGRCPDGLREATEWLALFEEFDRLVVEIDLIGKRSESASKHAHRRAHLIARQEATAEDRGLPPNAAPHVPRTAKERWREDRRRGRSAA